jgi:hypothetical protein
MHCRAAELCRLENVALQMEKAASQQMEQHDMASENRDQRTATEREQLKGSRSPTRPSPQSGSPILNDGPELLRSSLC